MKFNTYDTMSMREIIRSLIKESMYELRFEDAFADELLNGISPDAIFADQRKAKKFAEENLKHDIPELQGYSMTEYFPINEFKEKWMFEAEPNNSNNWRADKRREDPNAALLNIVVIKHVIKDGTSYWKFIFSQAEQSMERMVQSIVYQTDLMPDYKAMVNKVNEDWQQWG